MSLRDEERKRTYRSVLENGFGLDDDDDVEDEATLIGAGAGMRAGVGLALAAARAVEAAVLVDEEPAWFRDLLIAAIAAEPAAEVCVEMLLGVFVGAAGVARLAQLWSFGKRCEGQNCCLQDYTERPMSAEPIQ